MILFIISIILFIIYNYIVGNNIIKINNKNNNDINNKNNNNIDDNELPIKIKEIGILETNLGLSTTDKKYGDTIYICPKCYSKYRRRAGYIYGYFYCNNCKYKVKL